MEPRPGYNRILRKLLHISMGLPAVLVPFTPYWAILALAVCATIIAWYVKPHHTIWLSKIAKPSDLKKGRFTGFLGYALAILILVGLWPLFDAVGQPGARLVMLGWLALALGDGLAGLVGPGPGIAPTVPWCDRKTYLGLSGGFIGMFGAYLISFGFSFGLPGAQQLPTLLWAGIICAIPTAFLESLELKLDDNYIVGLGAPVIALAIHLVAGW